MNFPVDPRELVIAACSGISSPGHPDRLGNYQYTYRGGLFFPCDPRPEEVFIEDIAAGLSRTCRFNGQCIEMMSPAEHSYLISFDVPEEDALEGLLHDGAEGYIGDQIRSIKYLPNNIYLPVEDGIARAIAERFDLRYPWPKSVLLADERMQNTEVHYNIKSKAINHLSDTSLGVAKNIRLFNWEPRLAMMMFLHRFHELAAKRGIQVH